MAAQRASKEVENSVESEAERGTEPTAGFCVSAGPPGVWDPPTGECTGHLWEIVLCDAVFVAFALLLGIIPHFVFAPSQGKMPRLDSSVSSLEARGRASSGPKCHACDAVAHGGKGRTGMRGA